MSQQTPVVEWTVAKDDAEWERLCPLLLPDIPSAVNRRLPLPHALWSAVALLLLLGSAGGWWWHTAQAEAALRATAQKELEPAAHGDDSSAASLAAVQTADCDRQVDRSLRTVEFQGDGAGAPVAYQAVAHIITRPARGAPAYRRTRFYRCTATGWLQIAAPDAALWGPQRILETPSLVFHFRQNDAPVVVAVASQMDALYTTLRSNFGLPLTPGTEKLAIEVSVTYPPGHAATWFGASDRIIVSSPAVYSAPVELTDAQLVAQSIALPLVAHGLAEASDHHAIKQAWRPLLNGLRLWQLWDLDLPLAAWQKEIVKWSYQDQSTARPGRQVKLPDRYEELCAVHRLWLPSPTQLEIQLLCKEPERQWKYWSISSWDSLEAPTHLDQLVVPLRPGEYIEEVASLQRVGHADQTVALVTLIEYAVDAYGREHLPVLVAGMGQYESWDTLLSAVYGVSPAEFEAGWQAHLAAHYGIYSPQTP